MNPFDPRIRELADRVRRRDYRIELIDDTLAVLVDTREAAIVQFGGVLNGVEKVTTPKAGHLFTYTGPMPEPDPFVLTKAINHKLDERIRLRWYLDTTGQGSE